MVSVDIKTGGDQEQSLLPAPMLGRADVFHKVLFDDSYRGNAWREESDFQLSAREAGYKLVYCPHAISFNIQIENDRGGVHATWGLKRLAWQVRNNWRFVQKHRAIITAEFNIGNPYAYIGRFTASRLFSLAFGGAVEWKQQLFAAVRGSAKLPRRGVQQVEGGGQVVTDTTGKGQLPVRVANALKLIWNRADRAVDTMFRYIGCFGLARGPLLFLASAALPPARGRLCRATIPGSKIKVLLRLGSSDISVFNGIFRWHEYGWDLERAPQTVVDGGAYIGLSAIYFTMRYPGTRVIAVEASEENFNLLARNTSDFPNIEPVHAALWPRPGSLVLTDPGTGLWGLQVTDAGAAESTALGARPGAVRAITVAEIISDHGLEKIDLLKVDIEGSEKELFGAPAPWLCQVDAICIELHDWFKAGCSRSFFAAVEDFSVEAWRGENVLVARP
jgi:FkbM family methyltransferase